jgi:hypothetical protein
MSYSTVVHQLQGLVCWPLLCFLSPICIFERCLDSNQRAAVTTGALNSLATHLPALEEKVSDISGPSRDVIYLGGNNKIIPGQGEFGK